jgi:hypothetical protein
MIEDLYIISGLYPDLTISSLTMVITLAANKKFKKKTLTIMPSIGEPYPREKKKGVLKLT